MVILLFVINLLTIKELFPLTQVRVIAQNFVSDRNTSEAITVGLNTIREIYSNCPAAATEEMVRDLAEVCEFTDLN
jgi:protein SDA1